MLRKKVREQSLFKFLNVLKPEVWFAIVGAVVVTGGGTIEQALYVYGV